MRLKELFTQASRERDGAFQSRDVAFVERDQLREENQRLRDYLQQSANASSGTDSGYDSMSWTCDSGSSFSDNSGLNLTANAPLQQVADFQRPSLWQIAETRGFASDGPPMTDLTVIKAESTMRRGDAAIQLDYDELGLDFVLT